jgi:hypothetical protein
MSAHPVSLISRHSVMLLGILAGMPVGQALADTKSAVQFESVTCQQNPSANTQSNGLVSIMTTALANPQSSSYLINASLVTGLLTNTTVSSNGGSKSSASATGSVQVGVIVDGSFDSNGLYLGGGSYAYPGLLSFDARTQTLTATLGQALTGCTVVSGIVQCTSFTDQQIQLLLDTTSAHSFEFILPNVGVAPNSAPHRIDVVARVSSSTLISGIGSALASACYGAGSLVVDTVRLGHTFSCSSSGCTSN